ncbi:MULTISPECIES: hypothetical protein [unclassified Leptotrichia]|uniref:hypothetical protein n=1 Tax=unclassified Leptotrichia TaxID=2633022 RepID=UPI0003AE4CAB|nr:MULTISPECIES: hypothetical protein [unclassified Leptotrichia]ERL03500.1 hypothetical protein HMPREF9108_02346 [Leptotrichia sp. oral taxon 225 str. F0581]WLD74902.1 hypothetical protein QU666_03330 [Leptotrichia sp. HMT-225]
MFLIIFLIIFLTILFSKEKIQEIFGFILCMSVVIFGSVFYYKITFDKEDLNTMLTVSSVFIAISIFINKQRLIKISVINFFLTLIGFLNILIENKIKTKISANIIFTTLIILSVAWFVIELVFSIYLIKKKEDTTNK